MSITKPKKITPAAADAFISAAPDALRGVKKGKKQQISLTVEPALLAGVDALASNLGISRAATINLAVRRMIEHGLAIDPISGKAEV